MTGQHPRLSRRRELGQTSARSLLMTVLGEFVRPSASPVWTATLVDALALFDIEEKSARQSLARTAGEGWLVSERVGRRVRWSLTEPGRKMLTEGADRIYRFGRGELKWNGQWLIVLASVPEVKRDLRHRLRTRLSWAGFGSPEAGVWITPDTTHESEAQQILAELGLDSAISFQACYGRIGAQEDMVAKAWNLDELGAKYDEFTDAFAELDPGSGDAAFLAQTRLVHAWRRFPFLDPRLPAELLPQPWSGDKAARLFHQKHIEWHDAAQQRWKELVSARE
ncbi:PaaX family transcriptional regulator [Amycolatopsis nigrescens]|uniref:PaaX family transcriptional regulator n=1 Tax=Amycolatopsis nigrescens TaxID=381445 RepID=UPI00038152B7|nr:PaaX family transcriptional regulator C-terminal domain-containing protein [Amycolatopsis nigrescens]